MNNIEYFIKNNIKIINITYKNKQKIINTNNGKYIIKEKNINTKKIHNYLTNKNFFNFLPTLNNNQNEKYELYPYIEEKSLNNLEKATNLIYLMGNLHNKTTTYKPKNENKCQEKYENLSKKIDNVYQYYLDLQDYIETKQYMSPAEYLLIRNISSIYLLLNYSKNQLEKWNKLSKENKKERHVLLNNNICLKNYICFDKEYIINWDNSKEDNVIYDFIKFYKKEYLNFEMISLFEIYQSKYQYTAEELSLFLSLITIPPKVILNSSNYINTLNVRKILLYVQKTHEFISKKDEKEKETDKEKFE